MSLPTTDFKYLLIACVAALGCGDDSSDTGAEQEAVSTMPGDGQNEPSGDGAAGMGAGGGGMSGGMSDVGAGGGMDDEPFVDPLAGEPMGDPLAPPLDVTAGGRLSDEAIAELQELDADGFFGRAVVSRETPQGMATKVTFDRASGPICLWGDEFSAFYVDRESDKTMILLDGGGACWSALCAASATVEDSIIMTGPASAGADNPFADWNLVYVPYCDGSVFSGDNETMHPDGRMRYHHGRHNLAAGLDLARVNFPETTKVMIGGFSAGGYGTIPGMVAARLAFPEADLFVMNDSGPGVQNPDGADATSMRIDEWDYAKFIPPSCSGCDGGYGQQTQMFKWMLDNDPTVKVAMLSYFEDNVIGMVFNMLSGPEYKELLLTETNKVQEAHPDRFKRFMLPGSMHVVSIMWGTVTADGVALPDWLDAMVSGDEAGWTDILAEGP